MALTAAAAATLFGVAAGTAIAPARLAREYGIAIEGEAGRAYVRALGARDAVLGCIVTAFALNGNRPALATTLALTALVAAADFGLVRSYGGGRPLVFHAAGGAGLLLAAVLVASDT